MSRFILAVLILLVGCAADAVQTANIRLTKAQSVSYANLTNFAAGTGDAGGGVGSGVITLSTNGYDLSSIPNGATINGIRVQANSQYSGCCCDYGASVQLMKNGSGVGASKGISMAGLGTSATAGGFADLWSTTWTATDLKAAGFGVTYAFGTGQEDCSTVTSFVRHVYVAIDYTAATTPAVTAFSPTDGATKVRPETNLAITFDTTVDTQTGNLTIKRSSDNTTLQTIAINSGAVTGNGTSTLTINPPLDMPASTGLYINIDNNAITNMSGVSYPGISNGSTWNFTTGQQTSNYWSTP